MSTPSPNEPKFVSHNIPRIEVYQVTDDELSRMEEAATNVGNEFAIMLAAISITISFFISLRCPAVKCPNYSSASNKEVAPATLFSPDRWF